ncbi:MAG: radical SAM protein [Spirochaetota bacterium]
MRLLLINPLNSAISYKNSNVSRWSKYRIWKPLGLLVVAGLTPSDWDITIIDENLGLPDYKQLPRPDLVGITAFTSQAARAYKISDEFRKKNIPVVMGGIHASMCMDEVLKKVDSAVTGEAESIWGQVLEDFKKNKLKRIYKGTHLSLDKSPVARHDLLPEGYFFGSIQTSRGCPLNCSFCSVTSFNGGKFRRRPIESIIEEFKTIREKHVLIVDDNFIGTSPVHIAETKELLRAMIKAKLSKTLITQVTINIADDDELLELTAKAGCKGIFIGFESVNDNGLLEVSKKFNMRSGAKKRDFKESVRRIHKHGISIVGSFIMGLDVDTKGIGQQIASAAKSYGIDALNAVFMTPLPGTRLWKKMESEGRITANKFPEDWDYYTLTFPVVKYKNLSWSNIIDENEICNRDYYSISNILKRFFINLIFFRNPFMVLATNLSYRNNAVRKYRLRFQELDIARGDA